MPMNESHHPRIYLLCRDDEGLMAELLEPFIAKSILESHSCISIFFDKPSILPNFK